MDLHGFKLLNDQDIPEIKTRARLYKHIQTGAELLSLENDDENKAFSINFRTPPKDSTGLPHIMEHAVLCGSRRFPVKDPFIELRKGSLATFLNAFTFPDKTCYPVASQNLRDFYNLIDVYVDAVFYPLIPPQSLQQEGWHYEIENPQAPLDFKGIVFNEMKGAYSSPDNLLGRYTQESLFPDHPYGLDSGGDPRLIPDLTYEQFKAFHETYYHPSNARIFFYGDDDPEERLRLLNGYLADFKAIKVDSAIPLKTAFAEPKTLTFPYGVAQDDQEQAAGGKKGMITTSWLLPEWHDPETTLALHILAYILTGTPASPVRKALIDSGLGEDLAGPGFESDLRQMYYSAGMKGIAVEDSGKVEKLILKTLAALVDEGLDPDMIGAALNTIEFRLRENNTGSFPRGLALMLRALTTWLYDIDPCAALAFEAPLSAIKKHVDAREPYFETLIKNFLLNNLHRTTVILKPDPGLNQQLEAEEKDRLERVRQSMTQADLLKLVENSHQLKLHQETPDTPEALATIPSLKLEDLDKQNKLIPIDIQELGKSKILYHDLFTNGIVYVDVGFDLHTLPQELLPYTALFSKALIEMGTEKESFVKLSQRIGRTTGGIFPTLYTSSMRGKDEATAWLFLRGKATMSQVNDLLGVLKDILLTARFDDRERFKQILLEEKAGEEAGLVPAGHRVVNTRLRAMFDEAGWLSEKTSGVSYLFHLRRLIEEVEKSWPDVLGKLESIRRGLLTREAFLCNVTLDSANYALFKPRLAEFMAALPAQPASFMKWQPEPAPEYEGLTIPAQVNYVGKGAPLYKLGYKLDGSISVISNYLRTTWLYERIRLQGGAYGGFCQFDQRSGVFTYLSYRDPNLLGTLDNYDDTGSYLRQVGLSQDELTKSIIGAIGDLDTYLLPDAKGYTSLARYLAGDTDEYRQRIREQVLGATVKDFHALGEVLDQVKEHGHVVVLGSQEAISAANATRKNWLKVTKVL